LPTELLAFASRAAALSRGRVSHGESRLPFAMSATGFLGSEASPAMRVEYQALGLGPEEGTGAHAGVDVDEPVSRHSHC